MACPAHGVADIVGATVPLCHMAWGILSVPRCHMDIWLDANGPCPVGGHMARWGRMYDGIVPDMPAEQQAEAEAEQQAEAEAEHIHVDTAVSWRNLVYLIGTN